ncbi:MAG: hypothetical protein KAR40_04420 [Candidatus Sabulitectum sp.]|nr:hypothetical protein [Candidatus Sabulitectum sp.]
MKYLFFVIVLAFAATSVADGLSYTSMTAGMDGGSGANISIPANSGTDVLTFYTDESAFDAANPGLITEDYSSTLVALVGSDAGPLDYDCNNSLFALHTIVQGISLDEQASGDMVVMKPPFAGCTSISVGPNALAGDAVYNFTVPTKAFGGFIVMPNGGTVDIEVFGTSGSLGTTSTTGGAGGGTFWGVYCDSEVIVKVEFNDPNDAGELFANVRFGLPTALSRTTWAGVKTSF